MLLLLAGLYLGLFVAPADYQQGESYRIMFVHVPAAWMSMFLYLIMAGWAAVGLALPRVAPLAPPLVVQRGYVEEVFFLGATGKGSGSAGGKARGMR